MKIPTIQGIIRRRILVNYRAEPGVIQKILPPEFRPKLYKDHAIAGICLIGLEHIRPKHTPEFVGISSENAAHRIAVEWENESGETREGVYIPRRDTNSALNHLTSGTIFPGEHHKADFQIGETNDTIDFAMHSDDGKVSIRLKAEIAENLLEDSIFSSLAEASGFFEKGALGYSVKQSADELDGITLEIDDWRVEPLDVNFVESSFYDDERVFPKNSIVFDHALVMRNVAHEWHSAPAFKLES